MFRLVFFTVFLTQAIDLSFSRTVYDAQNQSNDNLRLLSILVDLNFDNLSMLDAVLLNEQAKKEAMTLDELLAMMKFAKKISDQTKNKYDAFVEMCKVFAQKTNSIRKMDAEAMNLGDMQREFAIPAWYHGIKTAQSNVERATVTVSFFLFWLEM